MTIKAPKRPVRTPTSGGVAPPPSLLTSPEQIISYFKRLGVSVDPSVDIARIIELNEEIDLVYEDLGINDAYIMKTPDERFIISVNSKHHENRQKFSMAHEYGHYLLHRDKIKKMPIGEQILHRNGNRNPIEYQANSFAAELLMPSYLVGMAFQEHNGRLKQMADRLQVSQEALGYRLRELGYKF